ncbi:MAG: hypothetical protein GC160_13665 [Acidobacteria bacterium]|nr:hypothetical protein [Acidobacteriota bacterium]
MNRRRFLQGLALGTAAAPLWAAGGGQLPALRGVYPIMQTPYLGSGPVDYESLAAEVRFLDKTGTHGIVWPQLASEYMRLSYEERIEGAETIVKAAQGLRPKVVIGVQAVDAETAVRFAKHADKLRPDAIIALPPRKGEQNEFDLPAIKDYYRRIGKACDLPLFIQAIGNISVEFIVELMREVPTLSYVKDEAGHTLSRITELRAASTPRPLGIFTGGHSKTLIDEMARGSDGSMPVASWVDLLATTWDLWAQGRQGEAIDAFSKAMLFTTQVSSYGLVAANYVLHLRGVFPNWKTRNPNERPLDEESRKALERSFEFVKPYLRA